MKAVSFAFAAVVVILAAATPLGAETRTSVDVRSVIGVSRMADEAVVSALTSALLDVSATRNPNVRSQLQLKSYVGDGSALTVPRAYVKVRLPWFRFIIGKSRVSFGRGFFFDAGDVIFGGAGLLVSDFTAAELRDDTTWLVETYVPLGSFSYLEGVVLPYLAAGGIFGGPAPTALVQDLTQLVAPLELQGISAGGRAGFRLGSVDIEAGYLFSGASGLHLPYVAAAGSLGLDWYIAASATVPAADADWQGTGRRLALSAGFYHLFRLAEDASLAGRLEGLVLPGGVWTTVAGGLVPVSLPSAAAIGPAYIRPSAAAVDATFASRYGLYLFPEVDYAPSRTVSFQFRSIISPIDASATLIAGAGWNVYQGLTLHAYLLGMVGADNATYGWNQPGGIGGAIGAEFIF